MLQLDFWNNPIVVSGFRVNHRRGGISIGTALYLLLLTAGGMLLWRYNDPVKMGPWPRNYFLAVFATQFVLSAVLVSSGTSSSIRSEVANRTLDFQRITCLSPRQILLGKLLGAPPLAYLLPIATVPLTYYCLLLGVDGVTIPVWLLLYLNLATSTIMLGMMAMLQRLEPTGKPGSAGGVGWAIFILIASGQVAVLFSGGILLTPWSALMVGLLTPVPAFHGIFHGNPAEHVLYFFGLQVPYLFVTPIAQLFIAYLFFKIMERRLVNPLDTAFSKRLAYGILLLVDILAAAVISEPPPFGFSLEKRATIFCLVHLFFALWLTNCITPWKESLQSWLWRFRGRRNRLCDSLIGGRSENGAALVLFAVMGLLSLGLFVLLPDAVREGPANLDAHQKTIICSGLAMALLILAVGTLEQWSVFVAGRSGASACYMVILTLIVPLHILGYFYENDILLAFTPTALFAEWLSGAARLNPAAFFISFGLILALSWLGLRAGLAERIRSVNRKLEQMEAVAAMPKSQ